MNRSPASQSRQRHLRGTGQTGKEESRQPVRVLLVDASPTFLDGLETAISKTKTLVVVGQAGCAEDLFNDGGSVAADVALVDIDLPDQSGFEVCQRLMHANPELNVVLLGYSDWDIYLLAAKTVHACGLLLRKQATRALLTALEQTAAGSVFSTEQLQRIQTWKDTTGARLKSLGKREWQVLQLMGLGQSNREIAKSLSVSEDTVEKHVSNILQKLELTSRAMLITFIHSNHLNALIRMPHGERFLLMLVN